MSEESDRYLEIMTRAYAKAGGGDWRIMDKSIKDAHRRWTEAVVKELERNGFEIRRKS